MQIHELTALARNSKASDIHISEGLPLMFRIDGHLAEAPVQLSAAETRSLILSLMDEAHREAITSERIDADFALVAPDGTRSRVNVFYQQGKAAATLRLLNDSIPTLEELAMPPVLTKLADEPRGLILVTGPTGSGKSTTLAAMIDVCPAGAQNQIRGQLAAVLRGVITQQLLPLAVGKGRCAATEILVGTDAVANLIREGKCYQIPSILQSGAALGMHSLNADLARLVSTGRITREVAERCATNKSDLKNYL